MEVQRGTRGQSDVHSWPAAATRGDSGGGPDLAFPPTRRHNGVDLGQWVLSQLCIILESPGAAFKRPSSQSTLQTTYV